MIALAVWTDGRSEPQEPSPAFEKKDEFVRPVEARSKKARDKMCLTVIRRCTSE